MGCIHSTSALTSSCEDASAHAIAIDEETLEKLFAKIRKNTNEEKIPVDSPWIYF